MANQLFVTIDDVNRLVANFSYKYATELSDKQTFFISELQDKTKAIVLKSAHNGLHVCLDDNDLLAACNASIEGQNPARFSKLCHSHYKGIIMGVGPCKVFGLRCLENGRAVTVNLEHGSEDYGVLMVCFAYSIKVIVNYKISLFEEIETLFPFSFLFQSNFYYTRWEL